MAFTGFWAGVLGLQWMSEKARFHWQDYNKWKLDSSEALESIEPFKRLSSEFRSLLKEAEQKLRAENSRFNNLEKELSELKRLLEEKGIELDGKNITIETKILELRESRGTIEELKRNLQEKEAKVERQNSKLVTLESELHNAKNVLNSSEARFQNSLDEKNRRIATLETEIQQLRIQVRENNVQRVENVRHAPNNQRVMLQPTRHLHEVSIDLTHVKLGDQGPIIIPKAANYVDIFLQHGITKAYQLAGMVLLYNKMFFVQKLLQIGVSNPDIEVMYQALYKRCQNVSLWNISKIYGIGPVYSEGLSDEFSDSSKYRESFYINSMAIGKYLELKKNSSAMYYFLGGCCNRNTWGTRIVGSIAELVTDL